MLEHHPRKREDPRTPHLASPSSRTGKRTGAGQGLPGAAAGTTEPAPGGLVPASAAPQATPPPLSQPTRPSGQRQGQEVDGGLSHTDVTRCGQGHQGSGDWTGQERDGSPPPSAPPPPGGSFSPPGAGSGPGLWEVTAQGPEGPWTGISGRTAPWPKRGQRLLGAPCGGWRRSWGGDGAVLFHGLPATERSLQALATHPLQTEGSLL